ncbi:HAMP domain-containing sensor histidine kinase [Longicatena caecimuris]|uniref:histidine kinase n=1 Tax=Longicatena caecimuris TaxID=1796635 RepID=A0A4V2VL37_9FIRM|nr:HAMP domain-containing sensor histidine kinase [Longicatena caecimuris]MCR1869612.1 HAMP domain-containing histidine kinase [Longicatena caecimuris]MCU0102130.1 HAMP domain-containing histidine kinase [Longicatena caecimuris]TCU62385.1 signal transduction histidine kinase [Longicatena caecimuris]
MKANNRKDTSIKWKIFGSLLVFIAIIILVLWLFQVFFLEKFYVLIKSRSVKDAASDINQVINNENYKDEIDAIIKENEFCVIVYENENETPLYSSSGKGDPRCGITEFSMKKHMDIIAKLQKEAKEHDGTASTLLEESANKEDFNFKEEVELTDRYHSILNTPYDEKKLRKLLPSNKNAQMMTYISVVMQADKSIKTIVVNAQLTPVNATIETIQTQFLIIAVILILIASLLAMYLSRKIATPIIEINDGAKILAKGRYDVAFKGKGYLEIEELSNTLNYAAKELSKVESLRRELIANMSHDLRTPLTMISGYGEVMRDIPGENTAENVQIIIDETKRLTNLVNDMLDLSKLQAGAQEINSSSFNITEEIEHIIARYDKLLTNKDFTIQFQYDKPVFVKADIIKINQVIYNLINNAINYCGDDHKIYVRQLIEKDRVRIEVMDHGEGIEKEQLPYIWERYYKVDKTHVRSKIGSGLGLSIVKAILELHKAEYGVISKRGQGTTFWFTLPLCIADHEKIA